uniref:Uncharacterized protein n=1 Tax=Oryza nivara TaxID=4536 RepID=A0A0E0IVC1_ORYNI
MGMPALGRPRRRARPGSAAAMALAAAGNGLSSLSLSLRRLRRSSAVEMRREREQQPQCEEVAGGTAAEPHPPLGRRLFLADVVERLDAVCAEELEHADPSEQRLGRLDSARDNMGSVGEIDCE